MFMKKNLLHLQPLLLAAGALVLVSSCQDYEPFSEDTIKDVAYTREFEKQFGEIDPRQDWDLFGQLARRIGPTTRATMDEPSVLYPNVDQDEGFVISYEQHYKYTDILPELSIQNNTYEGSNLGRVTQDFLTTAHSIELIPVHWTTTSTDKIGIYWYVDEDGPDVKTIMGKDDHLYYIKEMTVINDHKDFLAVVTEYTNGTTTTKKWIGGDYHRINGSDGGSGDPYQGQGSMFRDDVSANLVNPNQWASSGIANQYLVAYPVKITIPNEITEVGFWIKNEGSPYFPGHWALDTRYSEWKLNRKADGPIEADGTHQISYTATFNPSKLKKQDGTPVDPNDNNQYLCFEDWINGGDADLNDIIFYAKGLDDLNIRDNNFIKEDALLVCEDLTLFDFDFNDVILDLYYEEEDNRRYEQVPESTVYINGQRFVMPAHWELIETTAKNKVLHITPMAAGGAYESKILSVGGIPFLADRTEQEREIHYMLKETGWNGDSLNHTPINVDADYTKIEGVETTTHSVNNYDFNVGQNAGQFATHLSQLFLEGYIQIYCKYDKQNAAIISSNRAIDTTKTTSTAPQMMLLPNYFEWAREMIPLREAYTGFGDWVADITKTSWILDTQVPAKITDRGDLQPDDPQEARDPTLIEGVEVPIQHGDFTFPATETEGEYVYHNGIFVSFAGIGELAGENAKATLIVHYDNKPAGIYIDDNNGNELLRDEFGDGAPHTTYYTLSKNKFNMAVSSGGIWIFENNDNPFSVSKVEINIEGITNPEKRHNLTVQETVINFEHFGDVETITASSTTGATIVYSSSNTSIANVDPNTGRVIAGNQEGTCDIVVTAQKSTVDGVTYEASVARVRVNVDRTPTHTLTLGNIEWHRDIRYNGSTYYWIRHRSASTSEDLSGWTNGATLRFHYSDYPGGFTNFYIVTPYEEHEGSWTSTDVANTANINDYTFFVGNFSNHSGASGSIEYTLTNAQLDQCTSNGETVINIIYCDPDFNDRTTVLDVSLTKIAN